MRSYGAANAAQRTGRSWGIATAIMVLAGSVAVASVGYTLFTLSSLRSVAIDDAEVATFSGAADAPRTLRADAALDESNEAEEVNLLRRLEGRVEKMLGSLAGSAAAAAKRSSGDSAAALSEASIKALSDRLESLASQITELPGRVKDAVVEGLPKTVAAPASAPAATKPVAAVASTKNRNLVLGMAKNIELPNLYRFVRSLRVHGGDNVDIVIFTDEVSGPHEWVYGAFSVTVVKFAVAEFPTKVQGFHPSSYRWILMRDWMRSALEKAGSGAGAPYDNVLFIDVRDSVFQRDPFAHLEGAPGFYAFLEAKPRTIAECGWNAGWVRDCFGDAGLAAVGNNVITCSGTSMASWDDALAYAVLVGDEIEKNPCERNGVDQGMHNYFVYGGHLAKAVSKLHLITNEEGWIATVQSMPTLKRDFAGRVLNAKDKPVAVVHQYDRSDALKEQYDREFVWLESEAERNRR